MKAKDLIFPFPWESRAPVLQEGVLYVPKCYDHHDLWSKKPLEDFLSPFSTISIEYCSGNGTWVAEKAQEDSSVLWIAVEKRFDRVQKIWARGQRLSLKNLLVVCGEALTFSRYYLKENLVDSLYVNFPDPWPKLCHAKHRLIQGPFIREMSRIAKKDGEIILVTDDRTYSEQMILEMMKNNQWISQIPEPFYVTSQFGYGTSYFDSLWRGKGREIRYMKFKNNKEAPFYERQYDNL